MCKMAKEAHELEASDAAKVDNAIMAIRAGESSYAKALLLSVIKNTPKEYAYQNETIDGELIIKFWDKEEFIHYTRWTEPKKSIVWMSSAYPRAFFHLGFLEVKDGNYEKAINYLDRGYLFEPSNPKFKLEKAVALTHLGNYVAALELYSQISSVGPFVNSHSAASALRGKGIVLIEMFLLAEAESAFRESLKLEPVSEIAYYELKYIEHLKAGGRPNTIINIEKTDVHDVVFH